MDDGLLDDLKNDKVRKILNSHLGKLLTVTV